MTKDIDGIASRTVSHKALTPAELAPELAQLGARWTIQPAAPVDELTLHVAAKMTVTGAIAAFAGALADELDHHPRIVLEYAGLTLSLHTHDAGAITTLDLIYAAKLERHLRTAHPELA